MWKVFFVLSMTTSLWGQMNHSTYRNQTKLQTTSPIQHFTYHNPNISPYLSLMDFEDIYLDRRSSEGLFPVMFMQLWSRLTLTVRVTKYVGSFCCLALHGRVRLHQLPNPFLLQSQSCSASLGSHIAVSLPCRSSTPSTQWKELEGTFHPLCHSYSCTKKLVYQESKLY